MLHRFLDSHSPGRARSASRLVPLLAFVLLAGAVGAARADAVQDGDRALQAGQLDQAMRAYEQAAKSGNAAGQAGIGRVWLKRGRLGNAMDAFRQAQKMDSGLAAAWYGQGEVLRRQDKCGDAVPLLQKAVNIDRRYPDAQLALGRCLVATGRFEQGIAAFDKGLNWGQDIAPRFLVARGEAYASRDSLRQAGVDFVQAREMAPNDAEVRRAVGDFYVDRGTWELAIPELQAAVALDSTDLDAQASLARALALDRQYGQALDLYQRLTARAPDYAPAQLGLGDLLYRAGISDPRRYEEARRHLRQYVALEPQDPKGWSLLGRAMYRLGATDSTARDSSLDLMLKAQSLGDTTRDLNTTLGLAYAGRKEWDKSLAAFQRGAPGPADYPVLAQVYEATGHADRADSLLGRVAARDTSAGGAGRGAAYAYGEQARIAFRNKDWARAADLFGQALKANPNDADSWFYQGLSYKQLDRNGEAFESLRRAAALDSARADRYFWLGVVADALHRSADAEQAFHRSVELEPSGGLAAKAYRQLGYYELRRSHWRSAIPLLEKSVADDPSDWQAWLWLAQGEQNAGDRKRAAEHYRKVLALDPNNGEAQKGLRLLGTASAPAER